MELQWPLILFTTLVAWSAGLFAAQCTLALKGEAAKAQIPAWIASAILLVVGGIAVFFHLEHWERIFNGFGHLASGITQELIAIVVLAVVAIVYLAMLRKGEGKTPAWIAVIGIVAAAALVIIMAHSYIMAARPAWNTPAWILCILGSACGLGPATMAAISAAVSKDTASAESGLLGMLAIGGALVNVVGTVAYVAASSLANGSISTVGFYYDPSHPTHDMANVASYAPFADASMALTAVAIIGVIAALACVFAGKKQGKWLIWGSASAACALISAICIRVVFYQMGASLFLIF